MARLILRYPNNVIKEIDFNQPRFRIGSDPDNDLVLEDESVAPHQAEIETQDGAFTLKDITEDNTTTVNGKTIEQVGITYGDRIALGPIIALFYPPPKRAKFGERGKFILYIGAGAGVIIVSIALIFFFVNREINRYIEQPMGVDTAQSAGVALRGENGDGVPEDAAGEFESEGEVGEGRSDGGSREVPFILVRLFRRERLSLPEPERGVVEERIAVAVPRGFRRLFFQKIPISIQEASAALTPEGDEALLEDQEVSDFIPQEVETEPFFEEFEEELPFEEPEDRGLISRVLAPIRRLFGGGETFEFEEELVVPEIAETVERPAEVPSEETVLEDSETQETVRDTLSEGATLDPLLVIRSRDVADMGKLFEEGDVYSEEELRFHSRGSLYDRITLSGRVDNNVTALWIYPEDPAMVQPILRSGMVGRIDDDRFNDFVVGTGNGTLIAVNGSTGTEIFRQEFGKSFYEPVVHDINGDKKSEIIILFEDGEISAYSNDLVQLWQYSAESRPSALPLITDVNRDKTDDVVFGTLDMEVIALDGKTGFEIWRFFDAESEIIYPPVGLHLNSDRVDDVVFSTTNGFLYALDGKTGWGLWRRELYDKPAGPPVVGDLDVNGKLDIVNLTRGGILTGYSMEGKPLFTLELGGNYHVPPSIGDTNGDGMGEIVIIDEGGTLRVIEGATRREKWAFETEEGFTPGRIVLTNMDGGRGMDLVFSTASGVLFVLDGEEGASIAQKNSGSKVFTTPIVDDVNRDGTEEILVSSVKGEILALQVSDTQRNFWSIFSFKKSSWISAHHDVKNTGNSTSYFLRNLLD
jgi:outer membrane protein assembly factor BamB